MDVVDFIVKNRIVAIARKVAVGNIVKTAEALHRGGINCLEITFNQASPTCVKDTAASIEAVSNHMGDTMCIGAGTVLTLDQVHAAKDAGARFVLAPDCNIDVIKEAKRLGLVAVPGAFTPTEILAAYEAGADIVKLFPAGNFGLSYVKAIRGPINHVPLMAVGGINEDNVCQFLDAGFNSCGIGSNIVRNDLIAAGRFDELERLARFFTEKVGR